MMKKFNTHLFRSLDSYRFFQTTLLALFLCLNTGVQVQDVITPFDSTHRSENILQSFHSLSTPSISQPQSAFPPVHNTVRRASLGAVLNGGARPIQTVRQSALTGATTHHKIGEAPHEWSDKQAKNLAKLHWKSGKQAQAKGRPQNGTVQYLKGWRLEPSADRAAPGLSLAETTAYHLLQNNKDLFLIDQPEQEWQLTSSETDDLGFTQIHFKQTYEDFEVWPSSITVQLNPQGHAHLVTAAYAPTPENVNTHPTLNSEAALKSALSHLQSEELPFSQHPKVEDLHLLIYAPIESRKRLAYSVHLHQGSGVDWEVMVDAHSGEILTSINQVCSAAVNGSGLDVTGQSQPLELWFEDDQYSLVNTTKNMHDDQRSDPPGFQTTIGGILIYNANNVNPQENPNAFNPQLITSTDAHSGFGPNAVSASINLSRVYDYYETRHQRNSINGVGGNIIGIVNVPIDNAYRQNDLITFGNLNTWAHALDFAAHEMTHGVIEKTAGLIYENQPGALNEAFADIFGESTEAYHNEGVTDWKLGTLLKKPLRDMRDPASMEIGLGRRYPTKMSEFITSTDPFLDNFSGRDNGGVHLNSSIINHAFYQLAEGLTGSIGIPSAERIFYRAVTTKLQKQSQFIDCRIACVQSAEEIFGAGSTEERMTAEAFNVVEIFDQSAPPEPMPLPTVTGEDSTLFTFVSPLDGQTFLARRELSQGDDLTGILLVQTPVAPGKRPVVSRDGTTALFVTANYAVAVLDTLTGEGEIYGEPGSVWSVGLSPDGKYLGIVLAENNQPEGIIRVLNTETDELQELALKAPALDGGATDTILFADVLNFTPDGRILYYDALNRITFSDGSRLDSWSIYAKDRLTGNTISVVPPIPGLSIGNPALGRVHVDHLVFEAEDSNTGQSHVFTQDLTTGKLTEVGTIFTAAGLAFPDFFGDDRAVLYTDYAFDFLGFLAGTGLVSQPLALDGLTPEGQAALWMQGSVGGPTIGTIYRRGIYEGINTLELTMTQVAFNEGDTTPIEFHLTRTGPIAQPLSVQVLTTGSASPGKDYIALPSTATFEAGQNDISIPIQLIDDTIPESEETVTMTIADSRQYILGERFSATFRIEDNDAATLTGYALWASQNQVGAPEEDFDGDLRANLLEYGLGSNPKVKDLESPLHAKIITVNGQSHLSVQLNRASKREDAVYGFETSPDLRSWKSATSFMIVTEDTQTKLSARMIPPLQDAGKAFIRLSIDLK